MIFDLTEGISEVERKSLGHSKSEFLDGSDGGSGSGV